MDSHLLGEFTFSYIWDHNLRGSTTYIPNCDAPEVAYHLVYDSEGVSLDNTPQPV